MPMRTRTGLNERHAVTGRTPLHEAVMLNNVDTVQRLLGVGALPNVGHFSQVRMVGRRGFVHLEGFG